jgi:hypothetical protein
MVDYMDVPTLSATYLASTCDALKLAIMTRLGALAPHTICALSEVKEAHVVLDTDYRFDISPSQICVSSLGGGESLHMCITVDREEKRLKVTKLEFYNITKLIEVWAIMKRSFIELICNEYVMCKDDKFQLTMDNVRSLDLGANKRPIIAIPVDVPNQVKVNNISELAAFQNKFIIF